MREGAKRKLTSADKAHIDVLATLGGSHTRVAQCLGLDAELVRGYCRRAYPDLVVDKNLVLLGAYCRYCAAPLEGMRAGALFCCPSHRQAWWRTHQAQARGGAWRQFTCLGCGRPYRVYGRRVRKYCSHACYIRHRFVEVAS